MRPPLRSKKNSRPEVDRGVDFAPFGLETVVDIEFVFPFQNWNCISETARLTTRMR